MHRPTRRGFLLATAAAGSASTAMAQTALTVGSYPSNPPFEVKTPSGDFEGFEVDIVKGVVDRLGTSFTIQDLGFQALFAATLSKRVDIAISSITITEDRLGSQSFTQPYYDTTMDVAARKDSPVHSFGDLRGKVAGVISGTSGERWARGNQASTGLADVKAYNARQDMLLDLMAGRVDAAINDSMRYGLARNPDLEVKDSVATGDQCGMMMTKDHPMLNRVNDAISDLKRSGTMAALYRKWFSADPASGSSTVTVAALPAV